MTDATQIGTKPALGIVEWFWQNDKRAVERVLASMRQLGVKNLRTGFSWADWHTPWGKEWYSWLYPRLASEVNVLPCFVYTPPSLGIVPTSASPPRNPRDYADFIDEMITRFGNCFDYIELWNEPNNRSEWDYTKDPYWWNFGLMVGSAAHWARKRGKKTVLGGMSPVDTNWLLLMIARGLLQYIDVVGIHGFPGTRDTAWDGWGRCVEEVRTELHKFSLRPEIWITETGFSTWRHDDYGQVHSFVEAAEAPVQRVYWYSLYDLNPSLPTVDGFHIDDRDYHFGLRRANESPKLLFRMWQNGGVNKAHETVSLRSRHRGHSDRSTLITGGAGFIGSNLARRLLESGRSVTILDNLSRPGVDRNVQWLKDAYGERVRVEIGDVRDRYAVRQAVRGADEVFHFAAQVAVTTSLVDPVQDYEVNVHGTLNLLEELRALENPPPLLFTSTNKVYGCVQDLPLRPNGKRYEPEDQSIAGRGINESRPISFASPYGCSKGAADQYVLDYARSFGMKTVVFRMSCIYGPHQFGTVDQGWVAHFLNEAADGRPIMIYGDGLQVRDLLFVDDLVDAFMLAMKTDGVFGQAFNIGGGPENTISLLELIDLIAEMRGERPELEFGEWRAGDQLYYVSDTTLFRNATGWRPMVGVCEGIGRLHRWLIESQPAAARVLAAEGAAT